jgi:GT2 family glycosyltransferase
MSAEPTQGSERPDVSVVVVTHNGREQALTTLRSARAALGWAEAEWLVVDAGSTDGTPDAIEAAFADVRGRYVLLLNPDVEFAHGTLGELVAAMDARPRLGIAGVVQTDSAGDPLPSIRRHPSPLRTLGEALFVNHLPGGHGLQEPVAPGPRYEHPGAADWLVGAFLIARAEAVAEVGPLDERFFLYSEETDWCYRFGRAGWGVGHLPVITVIHHCGGGSDGPLKPQLTHSRILFARKHYGRAKAVAIRGALALGHALRAAASASLGLVAGARHRERARHEGAALKVALGAPPPLGPYAAGAPPMGPPPGAARGASTASARPLIRR